MRKRSHEEILKERLTVEEMSSVRRFPLTLICHNIRSMHNVGSIFRTSDAACIEKIYLTGYTAQPPRPEIDKTSLGATETVPWEYFSEIKSVISNLKKENYKIISLEQTNESISLYDYKISNHKIAVILGNEVFGIDNEILELSDESIEIPMFGMKHSLNVSVATGITVFELIKQMSPK